MAEVQGNLLEEPEGNEPEPEEPEGDEPEGGEPEGEHRGGDPAKALRAERGKRKEAVRKAQQLEQQVQQLQGMANEYQQLLPILPQLIEKAKRADQGAQNQPPKQNPELVAIANDLGFVNEAGEPDVERAGRVLGYLDRRAGAVADRTVHPLRQQTVQQVVAATRERAYTAVDSEGRPFAKKEAIDQVFQMMPPESLTDVNSASIALLIARGLMGPGDLPDEPTYISGGTTLPGQTPRLTDMEQAIAKIRGKSSKEWAKITEKMTPASPGGWAVE